MSLIITQGFGSGGGGSYTGSLEGTIPEYSSTSDTFVINVDSGLATPIAITFDENITGLLKDTPNQ